MNAAALVLAAGSSRRLGQPKQLLPYKGRTLLDVSLDVARNAPFEQRLVTVGGAAPEVLETVDFDGFEIVESVHHTQGCSSSIVSALDALDDDIDGFVLLLGDQPEVTTETITTLLTSISANLDTSGASGDGSSESSGEALAVCRYDNGIGHPFWFSRRTFGELANLHGDKAVWKLIESGSYPVTKVRIDGDVPLDVDTWEEYEQLLASAHLQNSCTGPEIVRSSAGILEKEREGDS